MGGKMQIMVGILFYEHLMILRILPPLKYDGKEGNF